MGYHTFTEPRTSADPWQDELDAVWREYQQDLTMTHADYVAKASAINAKWRAKQGVAL